jgi:hypothetical protein
VSVIQLGCKVIQHLDASRLLQGLDSQVLSNGLDVFGKDKHDKETEAWTTFKLGQDHWGRLVACTYNMP